MFRRIYDLSPVKSRLAVLRPRRAKHVYYGVVRTVREREREGSEEVTKRDLRKKFEETAKRRRRRRRLCNLIGDAASPAFSSLAHNVKAAARRACFTGELAGK